MASAASFIAGGIIPLMIAITSPHEFMLKAVITSSLFALAILGALGALSGGVKILIPAIRITAWGAISLTITALVGIIFKVSS
jgi:VIT1/CCC1 family predicted Fe2+/Mn2+ transporter